MRGLFCTAIWQTVVSKSRSGRIALLGEEDRKLGFLQVLGSVLASFVGVQKNVTRERDFKRGRPRDFIFVGLLLTMVFVLAVWGVVQLVMHVAVPK